MGSVIIIHQKIMKKKKKLKDVLKNTTIYIDKKTLFEDDRNWETVVDFTEIRPGGIPAEEFLKYL